VASAPGAIVLDRAPVIDFLLGEPGAEAVAGILRGEPARMSTANLAEVVDVLVRVYGVNPDVAAMQAGQLASEVVEPVVPDADDAIRAGLLRARAFDRRQARMSLADCLLLSICRNGDRVLTSDRALARLARTEGIALVDPG